MAFITICPVASIYLFAYDLSSHLEYKLHEGKDFVLCWAPLPSSTSNNNWYLVGVQ